MSEKILIFGAGQIGNFYHHFFATKGIQSHISRADITKLADVDLAVSDYKPTVVINTAAITNLERCNTDRLAAINSNVLGADIVAQICDKYGIYLIHISSGCIMGSHDEHDLKTELDLPQPISFYSYTKTWAEQLITFKKSAAFRCLILRPRQPVSKQPVHTNMLMKLLTFTKFIDTPNSGTVVEDWMDWTLLFLAKKPTGILNIANEGWTTPYQIGLLLKKHILPDLPLEKISKEELNNLTPEKRVDTILNVDKLKSLGAVVRLYIERLEETIIGLGENIRRADRDILKQELEKTWMLTKTRTVANEVWRQLL